MPPKTAVAWLLTFVTGMVFSFRDPIWGLMTYLLDYYAHPPLRWWGDSLPRLRWSFIVSLVLLVTYLLHGRGLFEHAIRRHSQTRWLMSFFVVSVLVTPFAVDPWRSLEYVVLIGKLILLYCVIVGLLRTYAHYRWFIWAIILGSFHWGVNAYFDPDVSGGRAESIGGPDTFDANGAALHLVPALALIALYCCRGSRRERLLALVAAPFVLNTIVLCNSRGATIAMITTLAAAFLMAPWRLRLRLVVVTLAGGILLWNLADKNFMERQLGIGDYAQDGSASGRIAAWEGALRLMNDHPLGVGGGGFEILSPQYIPDVVAAHDGEERAVHNAYLLVGSDWGWLGLFCFLGIFGSTLWNLQRLRRRASDDQIRLEAFALQVGLMGYALGAVFTNASYSELLYWTAGLSAALTNIQESPQAVTETVSATAAAPPVRPVPAYALRRPVRARS